MKFNQIIKEWKKHSNTLPSEKYSSERVFGWVIKDSRNRFIGTYDYKKGLIVF